MDPWSLCEAATEAMFRGWEDPFFGGKLRSENDVKVTGARGGEPCLCVKILTYLALSFIGEAKLFIGRDMVIGSISLELQHELWVAFAHTDTMKKKSMC